MKLIPKDALVAEITKIYDRNRSNGFIDVCDEIDNILSFIDTLEVKKVDEVPKISFPHYKDIVGKVFGADNLESWEYEDAEQLVFLAKEELLKDLEVKEVELDMKTFGEEMTNVFNLPSDETTNTEEEPLNWEYAIAKHFFELGLKAKKGE